MLGAAFLAYWVGNALITRVFNSHNPHLKMSTCKAKTLQALFKSVLRYAIYFFVALTVVEALGVPTGSIIASAGIVGLAIGFGAQNLVRDVITGFFILMEDQFGVGEYIEVFGVAGEVEEVGLRITKLRDFSGALHIVPNGSIDRVTNHHRGALRALVDVRVLHEEDPERVQSILAQVAAEVAKEVPTIVEGPRALGIADVTEAGMIFRIWARTQPMEQWAVEREIRRRVKLAFDREGIHTPYPRTVFMPQETANPRMIDD
jgi:small conductance mechanosensitive channel